MTILVGALEFEGPHTDLDCLSDLPGIYVVLCENAGELELLEMGESEYVREHLQAHPQRHDWYDEGLAISFAVHYTADLTPCERREIRDELDREFAEPIAA